MVLYLNHQGATVADPETRKLKMTTYYAITNVNGPISIRIEADSAAEAVEQFREMDAQEIIDSPDMDAEDDLDIEGADCDDEEFSDALRAHGCTYIQRLGTEPYDLWCLWEAPKERHR